MNDELTKMYDRAAVICSKSEKSSHGIYEKLLNWGLGEEEAGQVTDRLVSEKFIDDERFARSYVRDKFRFNKWGKVKIAYNLRMEKITEATIQNVLKEIDDDDYRETLAALLRAKGRNITAVNQYDRKGKLFRFAQSRGFEADLIYRSIDEM